MGVLAVFGGLNDCERVKSIDYGLLELRARRHFKENVRVIRIGDDAKDSAIVHAFHNLDDEDQNERTFSSIQETVLTKTFGSFQLSQVLAYILPPHIPPARDPLFEWNWIIERFPDTACGYVLHERADGKGRWLDWTGKGTKIL